MESKKPSLLVIFTLYLIYFLDLAGMAIVFILFAPLIIDGNAFLPADVSKGSRNIILGFLFASYPLAQFFGAPILGEYSDRIGRKKPLFLSAFFTALTFCLSAVALEIHSLYLLFFSRILSGFSAGNMTIAQAAVGDLIEESNRPRYMALFNIAGGISWIIAPYAGTLLSDKSLVSWFSSATPFWVLGAFFLLSSLIVLFKFKEHVVLKKRYLGVKQIFKDLIKTLEQPTLAPLLLISILTTFGWLVYQGFMSAYLNQKYHFSTDMIGKTFTYFSAWWFIGGVLANQWLLKKFHSSKVNLIPMLVAPLGVLSYYFFSSSDGMWIASAFANVAESLATTCFFSLFSVMAPAHIQGKVFGFWNAGFAVAGAIAPILSGILAAYNIDYPFILAFILLFASFIFYMRWFSQHKSEIY